MATGGFVPLGRTAEDEAAGLYPAKSPSGVVIRLTERQVQIMRMPPDQKRHVPHFEMVQLGKMLMEASTASIDDMLSDMIQKRPPLPEVVSEPFEYTPLAKPTNIRLVLPLGEDEDGLLHFALEEFDLDDHIPSYFCLSYCWSNPFALSHIFDNEKYAEDYQNQTSFPIACNGRLFFIRKNLYDALTQLPDAPGLQLKQWYDFNGQTVRITALQVAAAEGDIALVKTNIFRGAHIDVQDTTGRTAIMLATINGHTGVVKALLETGANPKIQDHQEQTCLDHALANNRHEIADLLLTFDPARIKNAADPKHTITHTKVWIDAVCINQQDLEEKNAQVAMMDQIYTRATFVTVWLGQDDGNGLLASSAVSKLFPAAASTKLGESAIMPYREEPREKYLRAGIPYISILEWRALASVYTRQFFTRLWCLQETVLQDDIVMYVGNHEIPWNEFMMVTEQLHVLQRKFTVPPSTMFRPSYNLPIEAEAHLISELRMRKLLDDATPEKREAWFRNSSRFWRGENKKSSPPLLEMIMSTITFNCFDPRDHIYALIGMCRNQPESPEIAIDYDRPFEQIYTDVMRLMIRDGNAPLAALAFIKDSVQRQNENLPSWVIHFAHPGISTFWRRPLSAAGEFSTTLDVDESCNGRQNELLVQGRRIDTVSQRATKRPGGERVSMFNFDPSWPSLVLELPQIYPSTEQPRTEVLWRTLCADSPALDDIIRSSRAQSSLDEPSSSTTVLTEESPAPVEYVSQFREQFCAMILSHAEKASQHQLQVRTTTGGVLIQALMNIELQRQSNDSSTMAINAPTEEEILQIRDTSLGGPYFSSDIMQRALSDLETIYLTDSISNDGPGCATPSCEEISAFIEEPTYRVWRQTAEPLGGHSEGTPWDALDQRALGAQLLDNLPEGQEGFRAQFSRYNGGRRLFVTNDKLYLGMGPMSMEEGDEVWVVKGSRVPFLLRKVGEDLDEDGTDEESGESMPDGSEGPDKLKQKASSHKEPKVYYKYVGDLYVHGIMHGEAVQDDGSWDDIIIVLFQVL